MQHLTTWVGLDDSTEENGWLQYVPVAVLVALIVPAVLVPRGSLEVGRQTWAALAGAVAAWRTRSGLWTAIVGMTTFWLLQAVGL